MSSNKLIAEAVNYIGRVNRLVTENNEFPLTISVKLPAHKGPNFIKLVRDRAHRHGVDPDVEHIPGGFLKKDTYNIRGSGPLKAVEAWRNDVEDDVKKLLNKGKLT